MGRTSRILQELHNHNPANSYELSPNVLLRNLGDVTKGRGPLIPLARSTGGVLANKEACVIGWNLVSPGGGETGDLAMNGT